MTDLIFAINATAPIVLMVVVGYFLKRLKMLDGNVARVLNKLVFRVFLPAMLFLNMYKIESLADVDFGYVEGKTVLHGVSVYAEPGQKVAFVGATGAGKTTITNLINRFYDIADGKIRYDGINLNKIRKPDLRRSLGIVLQDTNLFTGTVYDNIRYGKLVATDEECEEAAKLANAHDFIMRLPQGYNTDRKSVV